MHRNIARAYDCLQHEHDPVRVACIKILAQKRQRPRTRVATDSPSAPGPKPLVCPEFSVLRRGRVRHAKPARFRRATQASAQYPPV
jgi:hypothetical protein